MQQGGIIVQQGAPRQRRFPLAHYFTLSGQQTHSPFDPKNVCRDPMYRRHTAVNASDPAACEKRAHFIDADSQSRSDLAELLIAFDISSRASSAIKASDGAKPASLSFK